MVNLQLIWLQHCNNDLCEKWIQFIYFIFTVIRTLYSIVVGYIVSNMLYLWSSRPRYVPYTFHATRQQRWVQYEMKLSFPHPIFSIEFHVRLLKFVPLLSIWRHICVCGRCSFRKPVCTLIWSVFEAAITTTPNPNQQFWTNVVFRPYLFD